MSFSREIQEKIDRFTKEQSQNYLQNAEMTYIERLRRKSNSTKQKVGIKLEKFKGQSNKGLEAQNDMIVYMTDYMNDLILQGLTEQAAYEKAIEAMKFAGNTEQTADLTERFEQYYKNLDPAEYEAVGLLYAGFLFLGVSVGGLIGFIVGGGRNVFINGGWIDTIIGVVVGLIIGLAFGNISHGVMTIKRINKMKK